METWHIRAAEGLENRVYLRRGGGGGAKKIKGSLLVLGWEGAEGGRGGDTEGQRDTRTIHMLASRSPFQSHWPTNQGMAVTSFIIGYFFFLCLLNVCRLPASFFFILPHQNFIRRYSKSREIAPARFVIYCPPGGRQVTAATPLSETALT